MLSYKKILIPVDFSEHSELAARKGISLAQMYRATVYFLHVGENSRKSARRLSRFISRIDYENSVPMKKLVAQGTPSTIILAVAKRIGVDTIVMGSRGLSRLKHLVQGSVAEEVLRESVCPVIIIKKRKKSDFDGYVLPQIRDVEGALQLDKILVPLDFSPASKRALQYAVSMASYYNSTIYTLTVFDRKFKEYDNDHQKHTSIIVHGEKIKLWKEFPALLREINCDLLQTRLKRMLLSGDPPSKIESIVQKKEIDLIIMGTNGRTGLEYFLIGSVAEKVLRSVDCSIMTIRSGHT
jgi:nucleotide-binding universal stress UspA family protein